MLEKAIKSIMNQSYKEIEIVIVDDNSKDKTFQIVELLRNEDDRIKYVRNKTRLGLPKSRNVGLVHARGDLVFFSEDDMILNKNALEELVNTYLALSERVKVGAIAPRVILISHTRVYTRSELCQHVVGLMNSLTGEMYFNYDILADKILLAQHPPATSLIPKKLFNDVGSYYTAYKYNYLREESDLYMRALKKGYVFVYQPKAVTYHISGLVGGCTISNTILSELAGLHNHLIFLMRNFGIKTAYMSVLYLLKKILKLMYINNPKRRMENMTLIEKLGYYKTIRHFPKIIYMNRISK